MKVITQRVTEVVINMTEEEARWLKGVMQNPFHDNESTYENKMRERFWNSLSDAGVEL